MSRASRDQAWRQGVEAAQRALRHGPQAAHRGEVAARERAAAVEAVRVSLGQLSAEDRAALLGIIIKEQQP